MAELEHWIGASETSEAVFREACDRMDRAVAVMAKQLPALEVRTRGAEVLHRFPEKSIDVALGLKLIQIRGNIQAGELLIHNGYFFEWGIIQRSMHDALEDVTFLVVSEKTTTEVVRRYLEFFFDEDLDKNGELTDRRRVGVERREVRKFLAETAGRYGLSDSKKQLEKLSRQLHRVRSGSVHGRSASIMRAYFEESVPAGLWLGGNRERRRTAWERPGLKIMAAYALSAFALAGSAKWWDEDYLRSLMELSQRLHDAAEHEISSLKSVGWAAMGEAEDG